MAIAAPDACVACHRRPRKTKNHCEVCAERMADQQARPDAKARAALRARDAYRAKHGTVRALRCSNCDALGHNVRTCPHPVQA